MTSENAPKTFKEAWDKAYRDAEKITKREMEWKRSVSPWDGIYNLSASGLVITSTVMFAKIAMTGRRGEFGLPYDPFLGRMVQFAYGFGIYGIVLMCTACLCLLGPTLVSPIVHLAYVIIGGILWTEAKEACDDPTKAALLNGNTCRILTNEYAVLYWWLVTHYIITILWLVTTRTEYVVHKEVNRFKKSEAEGGDVPRATSGEAGDLRSDIDRMQEQLDEMKKRQAELGETVNQV